MDWSSTRKDLVFIPCHIVRLGHGWSPSGKVLSVWLADASEELALDWFVEVSVLHFLLWKTVVQILFIFKFSSFLLNEFFVFKYFSGLSVKSSMVMMHIRQILCFFKIYGVFCIEIEMHWKADFSIWLTAMSLMLLQSCFYGPFSCAYINLSTVVWNTINTYGVQWVPSVFGESKIIPYFACRHVDSGYVVLF